MDHRPDFLFSALALLWGAPWGRASSLPPCPWLCQWFRWLLVTGLEQLPCGRDQPAAESVSIAAFPSPRSLLRLHPGSVRSCDFPTAESLRQGQGRSVIKSVPVPGISHFCLQELIAKLQKSCGELGKSPGRALTRIPIRQMVLSGPSQGLQSPCLPSDWGSLGTGLCLLLLSGVFSGIGSALNFFCAKLPVVRGLCMPLWRHYEPHCQE